MAVATKQQSKPPHNVVAIARELSKENTGESAVVQALRGQVANAIVLYLNYKHYHWQTFGPLFRDLHKLFDRFADEVLESLDPLAERVRMIGQDPPAHPMDALNLATVSAAAAKESKDSRESKESKEETNVRGMIEEANRNSLIVIKEMRQAAKTADEHGDPGTVDLFSRLVQVHEKHEWWTRDILRTGDGLCT